MAAAAIPAIISGIGSLMPIIKPIVSVLVVQAEKAFSGKKLGPIKMDWVLQAVRFLLEKKELVGEIKFEGGRQPTDEEIRAVVETVLHSLKEKGMLDIKNEDVRDRVHVVIGGELISFQMPR